MNFLKILTKSHQIFGLLLKEYLPQRTLKNPQLLSHWMAVKQSPMAAEGHEQQETFYWSNFVDSRSAKKHSCHRQLVCRDIPFPGFESATKNLKDPSMFRWNFCRLNCTSLKQIDQNLPSIIKIICQKRLAQFF